MDKSSWLALFVIAIGTFLMRAGPLQLIFHRFKQSTSSNSRNQIPFVFSIMGPAVIAALLGTSLMPSTPSFQSWAATFVGILVTLIVYYKIRTLSLPIFFGVLANSLVLSIFGNL